MKLLNFYINWTLNKRVMYTSSNEIPTQNQLAIGGITHKLYIHAQTLKFHQYGTNSTFIFSLSMWDKLSFLQL